MSDHAYDCDVKGCRGYYFGEEHGTIIYVCRHCGSYGTIATDQKSKTSKYYNIITASNHVLASFTDKEEAEQYMQDKLVPDHDCTIIVTEDRPAL